MTNDNLVKIMASSPEHLPEQRLPMELITHVSSFLLDSSSLRTLARLNQASHSIQQETTKQLYKTVVYKCAPSWFCSVAHDIPKGWAHIRNLLLSDTTLLLMKQHLGFMAHLKLIDRPCMDIVFPKLELLAITDIYGNTKLTIYKSMSLTGIMERLNVERRTEQSFFGTIWNRQVRQCPVRMETVVELGVRNGAYLLPDDSSDKLAVGFYAGTKVPDFRFIIHGASLDNRDRAIAGVRQFLLYYRRALQHLAKAAGTTLHLIIPAEWLDVFVEAFGQAQPLLINIVIHVNPMSTSESFKSDFTRLADLYAANWSVKAKEILKSVFVSVVGVQLNGPASSDGSVTDTGISHPHGHGAGHGCAHGHGHVTYAARLELGHRPDAADMGNAQPRIEQGFTASTMRIVHDNLRTPPHVDVLSLQEYACDAAYAAS